MLAGELFTMHPKPSRRHPETIPKDGKRQNIHKTTIITQLSEVMEVKEVKGVKGVKDECPNQKNSIKEAENYCL